MKILKKIKKNVKNWPTCKKVCDRQQEPKRTLSVPKPSTGLSWLKVLLSLFPLRKIVILEFQKKSKNLSYAKIGSPRFYVQLRNLTKTQFWLFFGFPKIWLKPDFGFFDLSGKGFKRA